MKNYKFKVLKSIENGEFTKMIGMSNSIFLAGPCPREDFSSDWRYEAFDILEELGFTGTVITPTNEQYKEYEKGKHLTKIEMRKKQVDWERRMMYSCSALVFWVPRDEEHPARTTNIEFVEWYKKPGVFFGWPDNAIHNEYFECKLDEQKKYKTNDLKVLLASVVDYLDRDEVRYFTSDTHFGQKRTLELSRRPFVDVLDMDLNMMSNWNKNITNNDIVYHAGDFMDIDQINLLPELMSNLNFKELHWTLGNYDRNVIDRIKELVTDKILNGRKVFLYENGECRIEIDGQKYVIKHEPYDFEVGVKDDEIALFGHIHGRAFAKRNGFDLGIDYHQYSPISEEQVKWFANAMKYWDNNVHCDKVR